MRGSNSRWLARGSSFMAVSWRGVNIASHYNTSSKSSKRAHWESSEKWQDPWKAEKTEARQPLSWDLREAGRGILTQGKGEWVRDFWRSTPPLWTFAILDIGKSPWPPPPGPREREPPATECAEAPLKLTWNLKASDPWAVPYQLPPLHKGRRPGTFMCPQDTTLMAGKQLGAVTNL